MFEAVIAPIAFALIMLVVIGAAVVVYVRRRMSRGTGGDSTYGTVHPDGWRAADVDGEGDRDRRSARGSRAVNE